MAGAQDEWTIRRLLEWTAAFFQNKNVEGSRRCAELLLAHVLHVSRLRLYTDYQRVVGAAELAQYRDLVRRAANQEPVAYLTGSAHFFNLQLEVNPDVLIPRPDTEVLVENVIRLARARGDGATVRIVDLCTGSACVALALAANLKNAVVAATEISPVAAEVALRNIRNLGLDGRVTCAIGDLYDPLNGQMFDFIVANPPYIRTGAISNLETSVRKYEPLAALDGGSDGLDVHRRIWAGAQARLSPGGHVLLEIAFDQAEAAMTEAKKFDCLAETRILKDYAGRDRVIASRRR